MVVKRHLPDTLAAWLAQGAGLLVLALTGGIALMLWWQAAPARTTFGWAFLTSREWDPVQESFGALPFLFGTLATSLLALGLALPVGLGAAIYLSEMAPRRWEPLLSRTVELLAAIPSVVYGLLAALILVPLLRNHVQPLLALTSLPFFTGPHLGVGFLAASLILAIMILPILISLSRDALRLVPNHQREAALGLGATEAETILFVVLPHARRGITGAIFLALARALGETMAVTMVIGNSPTISASLFAPGYTIAAVLANEFTEASSPLHLASLSQLAFVLLGLSLLLQLIARLFLRGDTP